MSIFRTSGITSQTASVVLVMVTAFAFGAYFAKTSVSKHSQGKPIGPLLNQSVHHPPKAGTNTLPSGDGPKKAHRGSLPAQGITGRASLANALKALDPSEMGIGPENATEKTIQRTRVSGKFIEKLHRVLYPFLASPPAAPITTWSRPGPIVVNCRTKAYDNVLTGRHRRRAVTVVDVVPFSCELDLLEIRLFELNQTVDVFVVVESTRTHHGHRKPLYLAENFERFRPFANKIVPCVIDDSILSQFGPQPDSEGPVDWRIERESRRFMWDKVTAALGDLPSDTLILHGDVDEIPSGEAVHHLKHCVPKQLPLAFQSAWYIFNFQFVFADLAHFNKVPQVFSVSDCQQAGMLPRNSENDQPRFRWAGAHLSYYGTVPFNMAKYASVAEQWFTMGGLQQTSWMLNPTEIDIGIKAGFLLHNFAPVLPVQQAHGRFWRPWFCEANKARFPALYPKLFKNFSISDMVYAAAADSS
eukprot:gene8602-1537_t